ncbi:hypothetical protein TeGR_g15316 [Tetraparma gracilis]|uniref:Uncharacterized protein n=1 Tax=Tetraparma gracilis TaxID=2962635 RepID=A0ABQ6N9J0_9STRA|nr:hypothetical protein TeGR_g15316 [Tetraparma gracilis]
MRRRLRWTTRPAVDVETKIVFKADFLAAEEDKAKCDLAHETMCNIYRIACPPLLVVLGCTQESCAVNGVAVTNDGRRRRLESTSAEILIDVAVTYGTEDTTVNMSPDVVENDVIEAFEEALAADPDIVKNEFNEIAEEAGSDMRIEEVEKADIVEVGLDKKKPGLVWWAILLIVLAVLAAVGCMAAIGGL